MKPKSGYSLVMYDEVEFLARHRFPRPVALAVDRALTEHRPGSIQRALGACARRTLRFLAAVHLAPGWERDGDTPRAAPNINLLRPRIPEDFFISELTGQGEPLALLLALADAAPADLPGSGPEARQRLLTALAPLAPLAGYRLLVPGPEDPASPRTIQVLLGAQLIHGLGTPEEPPLPLQDPALYDPRTGRLLCLACVLRWEPGPTPGRGSVFLLRELIRGEGVYLEAERAGARRLRRRLEGRPGQLTLTTPTGQPPTAALPDVRHGDGDRLGDAYVVRGLIWRGAAEVYRAVRLADDTPVVLKAPSAVEDLEPHPRFDRELALSLRADHAGVIACRPPPPELTVEITELMELDYLPGGSLADRLATEGVLAPDEALTLLEPLCERLGTLHDAGITHLDLTPENLLFNAEGELQPIDLSTAASCDFDTSPPPDAGIRGTPMYVPPEQRAGQEVDHRADLWQLGVLLCQVLADERPQAPAGVPQPPRLPRVFGDLIRRLLSPDPAGRLDSAREVAATLRSAVAQVAPLRCIALDLEGTLLTTAYNALPRPHLTDFAEWCLETFDRIFVYTAVDPRNARVIIARFVRAGVLPARFPQRAELVQWLRGSDGVLKDLRRLHLPLDRVVLLDDMRDWVVEDQRHRWVPIEPFDEPRQGDEALLTIRPEILARFHGE